MLRKIDDFIFDKLAQPLVDALGLSPAKSAAAAAGIASLLVAMRGLSAETAFAATVFLIGSMVLAWEAKTFLGRAGGRRGFRNAFRISEATLRVFSVSIVAILGLAHVIALDAGLLILASLICSTAALYLSACDEPPAPTLAIVGAGA